MKNVTLIILTFLMFYSCKNNTTNCGKNESVNPISEKSNVDSIKQSIVQSDNSEPVSNSELSDVFAKAVRSFPNDSASLYTFYFKWNSTKDEHRLNEQIKRLEELTSIESVKRYRSIEHNLKPLMTKIVKSNTISKSQSDSLVVLYSDYDYFSGESLFSKLITNDENYDLVWQSFRIMAKESDKDTCFISGLIKLENSISTNAELSNAMGDFVVKAIRNNPVGFLEMYGLRQTEQRADFANYIAVWDEPDKELIEKFSEIAKKSTNENYRQLATGLIAKFKNR